MTQAVVDAINRERDGAVVDRTLLRKCVEIYEAMGEGTLEVYTEALQVRFGTAPVAHGFEVSFDCRCWGGPCSADGAGRRCVVFSPSRLRRHPWR